jgi:hypothetical protein
MEIAPELIQILFTGIVVALSLAFGLAFGLGGRTTASRYLDGLTGVVKEEASSYNQNNNR